MISESKKNVVILRFSQSTYYLIKLINVRKRQGSTILVILMLLRAFCFYFLVELGLLLKCLCLGSFHLEHETCEMYQGQELYWLPYRIQ